jgi:hypothetical protein
MHADLKFSRDGGFPSPEVLADFVASHARGGLLVRDRAVLADAIARGLLVAIVETPSSVGPGGAMLAMAGILPLAEDKFEIGGALVRPDMTGFSLQKIMLDARLAAFPRSGIGSWSRLYSGASRASYGQGSRAAIERLGFEPIAHEITPREFRYECETCTNPIPAEAACCYQFYVAGAGCHRVDYVPGRVNLVRSRDGARLSLRLPALGSWAAARS